MAEEEKSGGGAPPSVSEPVACGGGRECEDMPTVVYTVLVDGTPCTTVDLPETATLSVARSVRIFGICPTLFLLPVPSMDHTHTHALRPTRALSRLFLLSIRAQIYI